MLTNLHATFYLYVLDFFFFFSFSKLSANTRRSQPGHHVIALAKAWDNRWMPRGYHTHQNVQPDANPCSVINKGGSGTQLQRGTMFLSGNDTLHQHSATNNPL